MLQVQDRHTQVVLEAAMHMLADKRLSLRELEVRLARR